MIQAFWAQKIDSAIQSRASVPKLSLEGAYSALIAIIPLEDTALAHDEKFLFTSESVTEGHPDKIADAISDAVLDTVMAHDPMGRVGCETLVTTGLVIVAGEITIKKEFCRRPRLPDDCPQGDRRNWLQPR